MAYIELNLSKRDMARRLRRSVHCITTFLSNSAKYGKNFKGRPCVLSRRDCRRLRNAASNATTSADKLRKELSLDASRSTICRRLNDMNVVREKMKSKPPLTAFHKEARLTFCRVNMQRDWSKVWFTDEKRWCLDGPDCCSYYWHDLRKEPHLRSKRQAGGGSLMVWGGICGGRFTSLCFINGTLDSSKYQQLLALHFLPFCAADEVLVQDNAPVHASKSTMDWLRSHGVSTVCWPSRSPDLNPIENVWGIMTRRVYAGGKQYSNLWELKMAISSCWQSLRCEELTGLTSSMNGRVFQCIVNKGMHVQY